MEKTETVERGTLAVGDHGTRVSSLLVRPARAHAFLLLAHGAGAGMEHPFLESLVKRLAALGVATLRFQFPYTEQGRRRPDRPAVLLATVRAAVDAAAGAAGGLPLLAGGKSMGGRMTSALLSEEPRPEVRGLVFVGFPLHAAGRPGTARAEHLDAVGRPMLFLQGTRDAFADLALLEPILRGPLADRATLHVVEDGDHSFRVRKRSGRTSDQVMDELAAAIDAFARRVAS